MVSTAPGTGVEAEGAEKAGNSQASRVKIMPNDATSLYFTPFFRVCTENHFTVTVTVTLHRVSLFVANTHVEV